MLEMGGSVECPTGFKSAYVIIQMKSPKPNWFISYPVLCNVGIFTCPCSNYIASREVPFDQGLLEFRTGKNNRKESFSKNLKNKIRGFDFPEIKGKCNNVCTIRMRARLGEEA